MQKVRNSINKLFTVLAIRRIVCVDDQYDRTVTFDRFKMLYYDLPDKRQSIAELQSIPSDDLDFLDDHLEAFWEGLSNEDRKRIYSLLRSKTNGENDTQYASILKNLLQKYDLRELSLAQWRKEKSALVTECKEIKTLFLFDQDFSNEGGSRTEGIKLIEDVLASENGDSIICGLLSHTFQPEKEQELLETYSKNHEASKDSFVFISKQRLRNDPIEFARRVKLTALSPMCKQLKRAVAEVIEQAHNEASKQVELVDIYDFEHIIFLSSHLEGVWEPDTLFRLFGLYHRKIAREKARVKDELHELAAGIRPISMISTDSIEAPEHHSWEIQSLELYESEKYVNELYMPIELGDIFEVILKNTLKKFILLAQPCDLMIRKSGNRKQVVTEAILAEIVSPAEIDRKDGNGRPLDQDAYYELLYFNEDGQKRYVSFQQKHSLKLSIIDLCAYQYEGKAILNINHDCPKYVIPTWQRHYEKLVEKAKQTIDQYQKIHEVYNKLSENETDSIQALVLGRILELPTALTSNGEESLFTGEINLSDKSISYNLRRCGRLCQSHSTALLAKFAAFFARAAFEHDFGEVKKE